jgi:serine/threonine protein kinase
VEAKRPYFIAIEDRQTICSAVEAERWSRCVSVVGPSAAIADSRLPRDLKSQNQVRKASASNGRQVTLVFPLVKGRLTDGIRSRGVLDEMTVNHLICDVPDALSLIHALGCRHRDVKPDYGASAHRP